MDICIFIMAVFAVGSYIYKQFFIEATFSVLEILIISVSGAVVLQKIHDVVIKLIYTVNHHTTWITTSHKGMRLLLNDSPDSVFWNGYYDT